MSDYLTVAEAAEFLNTPQPTLYRWLRAGRVPAHKLGRQWRFLRSELEQFAAGGDRSRAEAVALSPLAERLAAGSPAESPMPPSQLADRLLWDAVDSGASSIHVVPSGATHRVRYRTAAGLETLAELPSDGFVALDRAWTRASQPVRGDHRRRLFLERAGDAEPRCVQVRYQKLSTLSGDRLTLRLVPSQPLPDLARIAPRPEDQAALRRLTEAAYGLVLVSGRSGSGKTTTAYCCMAELARGDQRELFTVEDAVGALLPGVNQVEVDPDDPATTREAFRAILDSDLDALFVGSTVAPRQRPMLWGMALSAAESGHLVFLQLEADSAPDAVAAVSEAVGRAVDPVLVGAVWQELVEVGGRREARYEFVAGGLHPT